MKLQSDYCLVLLVEGTAEKTIATNKFELWNCGQFILGELRTPAYFGKRFGILVPLTALLSQIVLGQSLFQITVQNLL